MKRKPLLVAVALLASLSAIATPAAAANWTVMVYMDADNNLESYAIQNFLQMASVGSDENLTIVVQMDRIEGYDYSYGDWTDCKRFVVQKNMTPTPENATMDLGEVNMGDPQTLTDFIIWAMTNYPNDRYALIIWDHGGGWREEQRSPTKGVAWDYTDDDHLTLPELQAALVNAKNAVGRIHVIGFDACLMDMIEVMWQIRSGVTGISVMVASEEVELAPGWPYASILSRVATEKPNLAGQFGRIVCEEYNNTYSGTFSDFTMAAIRLFKAFNVTTNVNAFANDLIASIPGNENILAGIRQNTEEFCYGSDYVGSIDLYHYAELVWLNLGLQSARNVMYAVDDAVVYEVHGSGHPNAHGLAIYYPESYYDSEYENETAFAAATSWDEFIKQAPRKIQPGYFELFIRDVAIFGYAEQECTLRIVFYNTNPVGVTPQDTNLAKFIELKVEPAGAIREAYVLHFYTKDDLASLGREDKLIGEVRWDPAEGKWKLYDYNFVFTDWFNLLRMDVRGEVSHPSLADLNPPDDIKKLVDIINESTTNARWLGLNFEGFVVSIPWHSFPPNPRASSTSEFLAIAATTLDNYPLPIQYPQWLDEGWDLVSIPVIPLKTNITEVLSGYLTDDITSKVDAVWTYDAQTGQWYGYSPSAPGVGELTDFEVGKGYWFKMNEPALFTVVGANIKSGTSTPPEFSITEGWNLIGVKSVLPVHPRGLWVNSYYWNDQVWVQGYLQPERWWYYVQQIVGYDRDTHQVYVSEYLDPQHGYWVYSTENYTIPGVTDELLVGYLTAEPWDYWGYLYSWAEKDYDHVGYLYWMKILWYYYYHILPQYIYI